MTQTTEATQKQTLIKNNFLVSLGLHGLIFITPLNKRGMYKRSFTSINEAYKHYYSYLIA